MKKLDLDLAGGNVFNSYNKNGYKFLLKLNLIQFVAFWPEQDSDDIRHNVVVWLNQNVFKLCKILIAILLDVNQMWFRQKVALFL